MEFLDWIRSYSCAEHLCKSRRELAADSRSQCKESPQVTPSLYGAVLRKVLKAGSGPDAPPSLRLLRSSHSHTSSDTHTYTKATYTRLTMTDLSHFWLKKEVRNFNAPLTAGADIPETATVTHTDKSPQRNCWSGTSWTDKMGVLTALILASQLLLKLCLHVEAQALGECYLKCLNVLSILSII